MALKVEKGVLTSPGSTGNQTISLADTGFGTVKALLLWATYETAEADTAANGIMSVGFGTYRSSTAAQWCLNYFDTDGASSSSCAVGATSSSILHALNAVTPTVDYDVALVSLGNAQFVVNWTDLPGTASIKVHYLALGGADITDALVGTFDIPAATGTVNETVVAGFGQPDLILAIPAGSATEGDAVAGAQMNFGAGIDDSNEVHSAWQNEQGRPSMETAVHQTAVLVGNISNDTNVQFVAELSAVASWPTDGFQVNVTTAPAATARVGYLALKGTFTAVVGTNTAPTAAPTVTQDLAVGQTPRGAIFFHNSIAANASLDNSHADLGTFGIGATDGTNEGWAGVGQDDANGTSVAHRHHSESKSIKMFTPSASGTLASEADASVNGTNIRLSWADTDTVAREYCYVLLGDGVSDQPLDAQPGSFTVTGTAATLAAALLFDAQPGAFAVTGAAALVVVGRVVSSDPGSFAVTGSDATLLAGRAVLADPGSFAVTGTDATLAAGWVFNAEPGTYTVTGTDATLAAGYVLSSDPAAYTVTGVDATLVHTTTGAYTLDTEPGSFSVTGVDATLAAGRVFQADPGSFTVTGFAADLVLVVPGAYTLDAQPGSYTVTGANATTVADRILSVDPATFAVTGTAATLFGEHSINAATGTFAVTGTDAGVLADRTLDAAFGTYTVTGSAASLGQIFDFEIDSAPGTFTVTGSAATLTWVPGLTRETTRGGRIRWNTTGRIEPNYEGSVS